MARRPLPVVHTGQPAPFAVTAPAYVTAALGWLAAAVALAASADDLAGGAIAARDPVLAAHLVGLVFFPFAVAAAVWQLLPVMLRNDPPTARARPLVLVLLAAGIPLAATLALERRTAATALAAPLALGLLLVLAEGLAIVRGAPEGKRLAVSRPPLVLALAHAVIAFAIGVAVVADGGPEPLGVPFERLVLVHVTIALVGWLSVLIAAVGRTLVPMLALAPALGPRSLPLAEALLVAGLWTFAAGVAASADLAAAVGIAVVAAALAPTARVFLLSARRGRIGIREGPGAHAVLGVAFAAQAAAIGVAAAAGALDDARQAAIAAVLFAGLGWAGGMIVGHFGKLASLGGWGSWPPGPRPKQEALYPRRLWQLEALAFAAGVEVLGLSILFESTAGARAGAIALVAAALAAVAAVAETLRRVFVERPR